MAKDVQLREFMTLLGGATAWPLAARAQQQPAIAALAIATGLIIAGWTQSHAATLTVGKAAPNADPIIPVNVGDTLGIFKKHGLDLTIVDFTGGSKMTQAMTARIIDIGVGAGIEMGFVAKGAPMTAICETAGLPHSSVSVCRGTPRSACSTNSKARGLAYLLPVR